METHKARDAYIAARRGEECGNEEKVVEIEE